MSSVAKIVAQLQAQGQQDVTDQGLPIWRLHADTDRYGVDFATDFAAEGWQQFDTDQDASYFGKWVNPVKLLILTYCEGDWSLVCCDSKEAYNREIAAACAFHAEGEIMHAYDRVGNLTIYRQDRSKFLIT